MNSDKPRRIKVATVLIIATSLFALLEQITSADIRGIYTNLFSADITVYGVMIILALIAQQGYKSAIYGLLALSVVWYVALIGYLPEYFNHTFNMGAVFIQLILTMTAFYLYFHPKSRQWYKNRSGHKLISH
ncbi:MAG: hypothetical protein ACO2ZM_09325 [Francisellaceae bacterium]